MKILIAGGTGMIGQHLVSTLREEMAITVVGRSPVKLKKQFPFLPCLSWQTLSETDLSGFDTIVNLAGQSIACRWHQWNKRKILDSRVNTTALLAKRCANMGTKSPVLINASAIGVYGLASTIDEQNQIIFDEDSPLPQTPTDFLSTVGQAWEGALQPAQAAGVRTIICRFGVVLAKHGGALAQMLPSFKYGLVAVLGSGAQPLSWVSLEDAVAALVFLIKSEQTQGPYNIVADEIVDQKTFAHALAHQLHRRCWLTLPSIVVKLLFGEMGNTLLLNGQRVRSQRLHAAGFRFQHATLAKALAACLSNNYNVHYMNERKRHSK